MGILDELGVSGSIPSIDITGFLSSSWIYVGIIIFLGLIFIFALCIFLFFLTYKKKVEFYENISGQNYQRVASSRARIIKVGSGLEIMKTLIGGIYLTAYGKKMGRNLYWFARGEDGYWYNCVLGDLDAKRGILDIEPVDRDVRMFHVGLDRLSDKTYGKQNFLEKYGVHLMLFIFLIVLILGMWFIVGKIGDAVAPLSEASKISLDIQQSNADITEKLERIASNLGKGSTGLIPAGESGG